MYIQLTKEPKKPLILQGFPGFGMIGSIVAEYLVSHLDMEKIGSIIVDDLPPAVPIHEGKIIDPVGIYFSAQYNLIVVHIAVPLANMEWKFADIMLSLCTRLDAWELLCVDGLLDEDSSDETVVSYYSTHAGAQDKLGSTGIKPLQSGIVVGAAGSLLLRGHVRLTAFFATTHSDFPDSIAAAGIIRALDAYLGLQIDPQPLLDTAAVFEEKVRAMLSNSAQTLDEKEKKQLSYVG
ncbi:MAG TPA: PAC2 family protein [Acidobacteriota bacterium]|nr:PAC2 family protein [Acidobacteriota bacterium]